MGRTQRRDASAVTHGRDARASVGSVRVAGVGVGGGFCGRGFGGVEFADVFGGVFGELLQAAFATEADLSVGFALFLVGDDVGVAHGAEGLAGDDAGIERVGVGGLGGRGVRGEERGGEGEREAGEGEGAF